MSIEIHTKARVFSYPIVGVFYRAQAEKNASPASALLKILPVSTELQLRPEPDNKVDPNAIAIWLNMDHFPEALTEDVLKKFSGLLANCGWTLEDTLNSPAHHLGYIPAPIAARLKLPGNTPGELSFDLSGKPQVKFELT